MRRDPVCASRRHTSLMVAIGKICLTGASTTDDYVAACRIVIPDADMREIAAAAHALVALLGEPQGVDGIALATPCNTSLSGQEEAEIGLLDSLSGTGSEGHRHVA